MISKIYIKIGGEWKEFYVSDFKQPEIKTELFGGFGCIEFKKGFDDLPKRLIVNKNHESWRGEGKRRMRVIK